MNILEGLFNFHIEKFKNEFLGASREIYYDDNQERLLHPGEFGTYREHIVQKFLRLFVPSNLSMGSGFIINSYGNVSTQCDIVIYETSATPLIKDSEHQRFFPCESVVGIGEVKSILSKSQLKDALQKLSAIKEIRRHIKAPAYKTPPIPGSNFDPVHNPLDTPVTFLICETINTTIDEMPDLFSDAYSNLDHILRHNLLLDMSKASYHYYDRQKDHHIWYPYYEQRQLEPSLKTDNNRDEHFKIFCSFLSNALNKANVFSPEIHTYLEPMQAQVFNRYNETKPT